MSTFTRTSSATRQLRTASAWATFTSSCVEVSQLLQVVDGSGLQVEAPTSAELVRHKACNPNYPVAGA